VKWRLIIRPRAEADLQRAKDWYDRQRPGLGNEFLDAVGDALEILKEHPERHPVYYRLFRRLLTRRFPYKLFYIIEGDQIKLFRVLHARRDHPPLLDSPEKS
jgi:plasmid stabilization system protein ParE